MEISIAGWIMTIAEGFVSEVVLSEKDGWIRKIKYKRFIKALKSAIMDFCARNECVYLNSSAFEYFIRHSRFVEKTIERALSVKIDVSNKNFQKQMLKEAREIASAEDVAFSHSEERIIKDLYKVIADRVSRYYNNMLSTEQKRMVSITLSEIKDFRSDFKEAMSKENALLTNIHSTVNSLKKIGDAKAEPVIEMLARMVWDGRFEEIDKWLPIIQGKSDDLEYAVNVFEAVFSDGRHQEFCSTLRAIESPRIRDIVIRNILPILVFRNENVHIYEDLASSKVLREIITFTVDSDYSVLFGEKIDNDCGVEVHSFELSRKYMCEEEWLVRQLLILHLHGMSIYNISNAMEELCAKHENWLNVLLISEKKVDELGCENYDGHNSMQIRKIIDKLKKNEEIYCSICRVTREVYFTVLFKADACTQWKYDLTCNVPNEVLSWHSVSAYVIQKRIDNKDISLDEVYQYCKSRNKYWLLVNFFVAQRDSKKIIEFCQRDENVFKLEVRLYFMLIGALREQGKEELIKKYLELYKSEFEFYFEYWNEIFRLDCSKNKIDEFISRCSEGSIVFLFSESEYRLIERLLEFNAYDIAKKYIHRLELHEGDKIQIKKYRAAVMLATDEAVEALVLLKEAFELDSTDSYVVDRIISLSLSNNRTVEKKYLSAAIEIGTSRMYFLVAAVYIAQGNLSEAKKANQKAILLSSKEITPAYGQFMDLETRIIDKGERKITVVESDTAVHLVSEKKKEKCVCVYGEKNLPYSPYIWNDDIHVYIEDAAEMGILRRKKDDKIILDDEEYIISNITPLDTYFFGICIERLESIGLAHTLRVSQSEDNLDVSELTNWLKENSKDEKDNYNWREKYNSLEEMPLPLFMYKRFTRATYLMFVQAMFEDKGIFIREAQSEATNGDVYVLSFTSLILLYEIGVPVDVIKDNSTYITESTLLQIKTDALKIINEYDRDTVSSIGVFDGNLFMNVVDEAYKEKIVTMAGKVLKYVEQIEYRGNEHDLKGDIFGQIDAKEILGICDYDAIGLVQNTNNAVLIATEFFHASLGASQLVGYPTASVIDWLIHVGTSAIELIGYAKQMVELGCLFTVNMNFVITLSNILTTTDETSAIPIYEQWDDLFSAYENLPENSKSVALQDLSRIFALIYNNDVPVDSLLMKIATKNLLELHRLRVEVRIGENGSIETVLYRVIDGEVTVVATN